MRLTRLGRFQLLEEISHTANTQVVKALDPVQHRVVAVKMLRPHVRNDVELRARLVREGASLARVAHPNVIPVLEANERPEPHHVTPLLEGRLLASYRTRGRAPLSALVALGRDLADALAALHSVGIVHRDLRPETVLVVRGRAIVQDLGLAKDLASVDELTKTAALFRSPEYVAPEVARGEVASASSDLYVLGLILVELALGRHPFREADPIDTLRRQLEDPAPDLARLRPELPRELADLVRRLLEKEPARRPANALAVSHALSMLALRFREKAPGAPLDAAAGVRASGRSRSAR